MSKYAILFFLTLSSFGFSQSDTSVINKQCEETRFRIASSVVKNIILTIPGDFREMGLTFSCNWKKTALYGAGFLGLIAVDVHTTSFLQNYVEPIFDYSIPDIALFNNQIPWLHGKDAYISYPLIGLYVGSLIINNEKGQMVAGNAFKSLGYSYMISHLLLKSVFARKRPQHYLSDPGNATYPWTKNPWDFFNFHSVHFDNNPEGTSMPSLHTTAFFAVAKVIQMEYDNYWLPYTFIAAVFMPKYKLHQHWFSDLMAGGIIGTIIGKSIVLNSRKQKGVSAALLIPQISSDYYGLTYQMAF